MPEPRRPFVFTFVFGLLVVYGALVIEISRSHYLLVSDYIDITLIHGGFWPEGIWKRLVDPFAAGAWLYRPFADAMSWVLALLLEQHVGAWHVVLILFRLFSVGLAWRVAREVTDSAVAGCVAVAYFAFFPAIPEIDLTRVETYLMLTLAIAFYGYLRMAGGKASTGTVVMTSTAFIFATMSKEVAAPLMLVLFAFATPVFWRLGGIARWLLGAMSLALANEGVRFLLLAKEPYAHGHDRGLAILHQFVWTAKVLLLATTNVPIVPVLLLIWGVLGLRALWRGRNARTMCSLVLLVLAVTMAIIAPYPAIRYLSPAAFFLVPLLAAGIAESRILIRSPIADSLAFVGLLLLITFGGAQICAQAASMRNSTGADWRLLQHAATALGSGRNVYMLEDYDFERAFWVRAELVGVDGRYPFITYVASRASQGLPIVWPLPPSGAVNLTGRVPAHPRGRFATVRPPYRFEAGSLVIPANPGVTFIAANVTAEKTFDARGESGLTVMLAKFGRLGMTLNPRFKYLYDLGESPFPGHAWTTFVAR